MKKRDSRVCNPDGQWTSAHQMSINGKFSGITKDDLFECAARNNIKNAARIIDEVCQAASMGPKGLFLPSPPCSEEDDEKKR